MEPSTNPFPLQGHRNSLYHCCTRTVCGASSLFQTLTSWCRFYHYILARTNRSAKGAQISHFQTVSLLRFQYKPAHSLHCPDGQVFHHLQVQTPHSGYAQEAPFGANKRTSVHSLLFQDSMCLRLFSNLSSHYSIFKLNHEKGCFCDVFAHITLYLFCQVYEYATWRFYVDFGFNLM